MRILLLSLMLVGSTNSWLDYESIRPQCIEALQHNDADKYGQLLDGMFAKYTPTFESRHFKGNGIISITRIFTDLLGNERGTDCARCFLKFFTKSVPFNFSNEFDFFLHEALIQGYSRRMLESCSKSELITPDLCDQEFRPWIVRAITWGRPHCLQALLEVLISPDMHKTENEKILFLKECLIITKDSRISLMLLRAFEAISPEAFNDYVWDYIAQTRLEGQDSALIARFHNNGVDWELTAENFHAKLFPPLTGI